MLLMNLVVLIWGGSGVVGHEMNLPIESIVLERMLLAALFLGPILLIKIKGNLRSLLIGRLWFLTFLSGLSLAAYMWCFFTAIALSKVSIGVISTSAVPLFAVLLKSVLNKSRLRWSEIFFATLCIVGMTVIYGFESQYAWGLMMGLSSAFFYALYTSLSDLLIDSYHPLEITVLQMGLGGIAWALLASLLQESFSWPVFPETLKDMSGLLYLSLMCTAVAMLALNYCLKKLSLFTVSLIQTLEPVYGILLALMLYGDSEFLSFGFYIGAAILLGLVFADSYWKFSAPVAIKEETF